ncbi:MAG: alpha/beta hydrolase [Clostridiaceae bacterium]|nr:alpha/beta hydrolase [Clostridiaceae bacterium]
MVTDKHMVVVTDDDLSIRGLCRYDDDVEAKTNLLIVHGMLEHIKRYRDLTKYLAESGIRVYMFDLRGHGDTDILDDRRGYFADRNGDERLLSDLDSIINFVKADFEKEKLEDLPFVILGHSMGSFIVHNYMISGHEHKVDAIVLSGSTALKGAVEFGHKLASIQTRLLGPHSEGRLLTRLAFGPYMSKIRPKRTSNDWLTRDEDIVDRYNDDPGCTFVFTASGFRDLFSLILNISRENRTHLIPKTTKVLIISGSEDPVGNYGAGPKQLEQFMVETGHDTMLKIYEGGRHEMFNEINRKDVYADLLEFLLRLSENPASREGALASGPGEILKE